MEALRLARCLRGVRRPILPTLPRGEETHGRPAGADSRTFPDRHPPRPPHHPTRTRASRSHADKDDEILRFDLLWQGVPAPREACVESKKLTCRPKSAPPAKGRSAGGRNGNAAGQRSASAATPVAAAPRAAWHKKARVHRADFKPRTFWPSGPLISAYLGPPERRVPGRPNGR